MAAALSLPASAQANNCCFELRVDNTARFSIDYRNDGYGYYDGTQSFNQFWNVYAIVGYKHRGGGRFALRGGYSKMSVREYAQVTVCADGSSPCFNRKPAHVCGDAHFDPSSGSYFSDEDSDYSRGADVLLSDTLIASPPDDVYHSVTPKCSTGHDHHGYGDDAFALGVNPRGFVGPRPKARFLGTASKGTRCSYFFADDEVSTDGDHAFGVPGGHDFAAVLGVGYSLSYFPKKQLDDKRDRLEKLGIKPSQAEDWGTHGTGHEECA